jgi:hypothetical protein
VVVNLEAAIKLGLPLLQLLVVYLDGRTKDEIFLLRHRIRTLWVLCISVGAALCESEIDLVPGIHIEKLIPVSSWIAKTLEGVLARTRELSLVEGTFAGLGPLSGPSNKERAAFRKFSVETNKQHSSNMDATARSLAIVNFGLQLKIIED